MASAARASLKQYLLLALVLVGVVLVVLVWAENLSDAGPGAAGFQRGTPLPTRGTPAEGVAPAATPHPTHPSDHPPGGGGPGGG